MSTKRRYFTVEGPEAESLKKTVLDMVQAQHDQRRALQSKYGADATWTYRNGAVCGLAYAAKGVIPPDFPEGLKLDSKRESDGTTYFVCVPNRRTAAGKRIDKEFKAIAELDGSAHIVDHFNASRWVPQTDGSSRTGMSMAVSTAGIIKGRMFLTVPQDDGDPFTPPACLRELKKSEFIALTEE